MPPALVARIATFRQNKMAMQKRLWHLLLEARNSIDIQRIAYSKTPEGKYSLMLGVSPSYRDEGKLKKIQENFTAFSRDSVTHSLAMNQELAAIRNEIAAFIGTGTAEAKSVDRSLLDCLNAIEDGEDWQLYVDYRTAVLEPGLSPGQRRLLFDAALVDLELPLPGFDRGPQAGSGRRGYANSSAASPSAAAPPAGSTPPAALPR
ncbi:MAG: hypothetical protein EXS39_04330 [Opitutaceae bacterium]|nr:hypothetical protein [Opitutaceae bacterium]